MFNDFDIPTVEKKKRGKGVPQTNRAGNDKVSKSYDCCQTPAYAITSINRFIKPNSVIWESAAGEGYLAAALRRAGHTVIAGDILTGQNFFTATPPVGCTLQMTNPPYSGRLKLNWLIHSYELGIPFAFLVPVSFIGSSVNRYFEKYGVEIMLLDKRVNFKMPNIGWFNSKSQFPTCWVCHNVLPEPLMFGRISYQSVDQLELL